jgi:hypothetical protein
MIHYDTTVGVTGVTPERLQSNHHRYHRRGIRQ